MVAAESISAAARPAYHIRFFFALSRGTLIGADLFHVRRAQPLGPLLQPEQHAARHDEPRRLDRIRSQPSPDASCTHAAARHEPCSMLVDWIETKLPDPIQRAQVPHV